MKIDLLLIEELECAYRASYASTSSKLELLNQALIKNDLLKFFLTVSWEARIMQDKKYMLLSEKLIETGKMLFRWKQYLEMKK